MMIVPTLNAVTRVEDWSQCRSPARARRRRRRGFPQRVVIRMDPATYQIGATLYVHPTLYEELKRHTRPGEDVRRPLGSLFYGWPF